MTNHINRRLLEHQKGLNKECYTFARRPVELVFCTEFNEVLQAIAFEKQVKGWSRKKKEAIINDKWDDLNTLSECQNNSNSKNYIKESFGSSINLGQPPIRSTAMNEKEPFDFAQGDNVVDNVSPSALLREIA